MKPTSRLEPELLNKLSCPTCQSKLELAPKHLRCSNSKCRSSFPIINGVPILINESSSLFSIQDIARQKETFFHPASTSLLKRFINKLIPSISKNIQAGKNYLIFQDLVLKQNPRPKVLILGGGIEGEGLKELLTASPIQFIETDISFNPRTLLICDSHNIPFEDKTFDGVIIQAVLEHVVDPQRCVNEIHRVLKDNSFVYAETAFMQQVHGGKYDFTRYTHLGHRRLFRQFECLDDGPSGGPGMALAWAYKYFLLSFAKSRITRSLLDTFASFTSFWLKYLDFLLIGKPGTLDAAAGFYFLGRKSNRSLSDQDLIKLYKGFF